MQNTKRMIVAQAVVLGFAGSAYAVPIVGVDFEDGEGGWSRAPSLLFPGILFTVDADWTLRNNGLIRNDNGANAAGAFEGNFPARLQEGGAFSITIPVGIGFDLDNVSFQVRAATGSTGALTSRDVEFNTSIDGATLPNPGVDTQKTGDILFSSGGLAGRPTWTPVSIDLADNKYKALTDTSVSFHWYSNNAVDIDDIVISGDFFIIDFCGDTDGDCDIDDSDLGTAFSNYTGPVGALGGKTAMDGDTDGDGDVDDSDLGTLFSGYTGPLTAAVPEPTSLALLGLGGLLLARRRHG